MCVRSGIWGTATCGTPPRTGPVHAPHSILLKLAVNMIDHVILKLNNVHANWTAGWEYRNIANFFNTSTCTRCALTLLHTSH